MGGGSQSRTGVDRHRYRRAHSIRPAGGTTRKQITARRARYVDPEPVPNSLEVREVSEQARGHGQVLGAKTKV